MFLLQKQARDLHDPGSQIICDDLLVPPRTVFEYYKRFASTKMGFEGTRLDRQRQVAFGTE